MSNFLAYYIWVIIGLFEMLFLYRKCIYDCEKECGISLQRYLYLVWLIGIIIPVINIGIDLTIPIVWIFNGYSFKCKLIEKLKNTKVIKYLNRKI